jgi:hypothetical protein
MEITSTFWREQYFSTNHALKCNNNMSQEKLSFHRPAKVCKNNGKKGGCVTLCYECSEKIVMNNTTTKRKR